MQDYKPDQNESWQIVTMFAVLDAMQDPVGDLKRIRALVAEDGILAIRIGSRYRTPFFSSPRFGFGGVVPRMVRAPLDNFRPHRKIEPDFHPFFFTHVTLRAMLSVAGFEVIHCTSQYEGGTRIIARAGAPKKLEDVELEDPIALHQDFIRWQRFDRWIRPIYATLVERPVIALANLVR